MIGWLSGIWLMIVSALELVTITSLSAFTSVEQLMYVSAMWSGCASRKALNLSGGQESSRLQPASMSGRTTIFSGERILAVSAMNLTPQKAITSASVSAALRSEERRVGKDWRARWWSERQKHQ